MRDYFSISQAYKEIRLFQEIEASKSRENFIKYATSKKASLKRKKKKGLKRI